MPDRPPPFTSIPPSGWLGHLLMRAGGRVRERTDAALLPLGLSGRTLGVLSLIDRQPGLRQVLISSHMGFDRTSTSQLIDDLTRAGLVERATDEQDRRSHALRLTAEGRNRLAQATVAGILAERDVTAELSDGELDQLKQSLARMLAMPSQDVG